MLTPDMEKDWMESRGIKDQGWTEQELEWLKRRTNPEAPAPCVEKPGYMTFTRDDCKDCDIYIRNINWCPFSSGWRDAAEFEARVAELMSKPYFYTGCHQCYYSHEHKCSVQMHKGNIDVRWCLLKFRRIAVEEMMEKING